MKFGGQVRREKNILIKHHCLPPGFGSRQATWENATNIDIRHHQCLLSNIIHKVVYNRLVESAPNMRSKSLALSTSLPHAGTWLQAVPSKSLGLNLQDREFRICLQYWLGINLAGQPFQCPSCWGHADAWGDHQVGCGPQDSRITSNYD